MLFVLSICALWMQLAVSVDDAYCFGALQLDLPVRYLHIQLYENGVNVTESKGKLDVSLQTQCRLRWEQIDNFDGSYVLRIRLWSTCESIILTIKSPGGVLICGSPLVIKKENGSLLYAEFCDCPEMDITEWMRIARCASHNKQLDMDLQQWKVIDFEQVLHSAMQTWASPDQRYSVAICHYQIVDNQLYRRCFGEYCGFRTFIDEILTSIMRKMHLPNTEFIFNLGDWPLEKKRADGVAIVSWCGSNDTMDIVVPTYELIKSVLDSMHTISLDMHTARGGVHRPWRKKKDTAVFRGRDSSKLRLEVAMLSKKHPDLIEAGITRYFFFNESLYTPQVKQMPFPEFFQHRYVLSIDGTVAAYRLPFLLAGDSVIFKSNSPFYEHFYSLMQPGLHYIPFDSSDLVEKIKLARTQDFNKTLNAMRQLVLDHLQPVNLYCYYVRFIKEYTKKLRRVPQVVATNMEHVKRNATHDDRCKCASHNRSYRDRRNNTQANERRSVEL
uniref:Glycosyl transferase CAP10 domain-containing protein n=1 Tax=Parascaris univalens TaxID=6257 RepID=A0A915BQ13_PARUN